MFLVSVCIFLVTLEKFFLFLQNIRVSLSTGAVFYTGLFLCMLLCSSVIFIMSIPVRSNKYVEKDAFKLFRKISMSNTSSID